MQSALKFYQAQIKDVEPGAIFSVSIGQTSTICMAVEPLGNENVPGLLALSPGHPMLRNGVGYLAGSTISGYALLVYPEAMFAPSPNIEHLNFHRYNGSTAGSLVLKGNRYYIVAATGSWQKGAFSCENGILDRDALHSNESISFNSWEILIESPGGDPHTLCVVNAQAGDS